MLRSLSTLLQSLPPATADSKQRSYVDDLKLLATHGVVTGNRSSGSVIVHALLLNPGTAG